MTVPLDDHVVLDVAVRAVAEPLAGRPRWAPPPDTLPDALVAQGACFVTLHCRGTLAGCIGTLQAHRPLGVDIAANAAAAAFDDPRMPPVSVRDLPALAVEVSVLSALVEVRAGSVAEVAGLLRPGLDGVVVADATHRATYLPAVWRALGDPEAFLASLWRKAGLSPGTWTSSMTVSRYTVVSVSGWARDHLPEPGRH